MDVHIVAVDYVVNTIQLLKLIHMLLSNGIQEIAIAHQIIQMDQTWWLRGYVQKYVYLDVCMNGMLLFQVGVDLELDVLIVIIKNVVYIHQ